MSDSKRPADPCAPSSHLLCRDALKEIGAVVKRHHGAVADTMPPKDEMH